MAKGSPRRISSGSSRRVEWLARASGGDPTEARRELAREERIPLVEIAEIAEIVEIVGPREAMRSAGYRALGEI